MWENKYFMIFWLTQVAAQHHHWRNAGRLPQRLLDLISLYNERGGALIDTIISIRTNNEESYPFEMGYVMSEILERYRQMVGLVQRGRKFKMDSLFDTIKHAELIQKLYFEIFHLTNMLSEINRKYSHATDEVAHASDATIGHDMVNTILDKQKEIDRIRKIEKKKRMKQMKKDREMYMKQGKVMDRKIRKPANKWWPIDYGWEIDYKWW